MVDVTLSGVRARLLLEKAGEICKKKRPQGRFLLVIGDRLLVNGSRHDAREMQVRL